MKQHLLLLLMATSALCHAQDDKHISGSLAPGWMDGPAAEVQLGYTTGQLSANVGFITPLIFERDDRQVVYFKPEFAIPVGKQGSIGVGAGYCMHIFKEQQYRGEDLPTGLTTTGIIFSLRYLYRIDEGVQVYTGAATTRAVVSFSLGVRIKIINLK